jgi:hypothetical protein
VLEADELLRRTGAPAAQASLDRLADGLAIGLFWRRSEHPVA